MKKLFSFFFFFLSINVSAQKKMVAVTQSTLTGIALPAGSIQDNRMLSISSAKMLIGMETKKSNITVSNTEVLILPAENLSGYNKEIIIKSLTETGWIVSENEGDKNYSWLQKGNQSIMMYFSSTKKESNLYFAVTSAAPTQNTQVTNTNNNQTIPVENNEKEQTNDTTVQTHSNEVIQQTNQIVPTPASSGFAFNTTNFDDGWTSTVQEDWVEVTKGAIKVLIHYPNKKADAYNSVVLEGLKNAWNVLVAPRYSSASNFEFKPITGWQTIEFAEADMVEMLTGKTVHVVLFKMNYSNGSGRYLEFITANKNSFEQEFGAYHQTTSGWENMEKLANYNKFAVAASDLTGKWTNDFSGAIQYVNAATGFDSHMATHASVENFHITAANTYHWDLGVASGNVGNIKFQSVKSSGNLSMTGNWKVNFSDIEGKPRTYNVYFSCIKGLRILWLDDRAFAKAN
jgi:hypothetical protein